MNASQLSKEFIENSFPEQLDENFRIKYYVKYEYPNKQKELQRYWPKAIDTYLEDYQESFCVSVEGFIKAFTLERSRPSCIASIFHELTKEGSDSDYLVLENLHEDLNKLNFVIDKVSEQKVENQGFQGNLISPLKDSFSNMLGFSYKQQEIKSLAPNSIIVNRKIISRKFLKMQKKLVDIFDTSQFLSIEDFDTFASTMMDDLSHQDLTIMKHLILANGDIQVISLNMGSRSTKKFYTNIKKNNSEELKMQSNMFELRAKIDNYDIKIDSYSDKLKALEFEILAKLRLKDRDGAKRILRNKKRLSEVIQNLVNQQEYLQKSLFSLENLFGDSDFANSLKEYNKIIEKNQEMYDEMTEAAENVKKFTDQQKAFNQQLEEDSDSDLDNEFDKIEKEIQQDKAKLNEVNLNQNNEKRLNPQNLTRNEQRLEPNVANAPENQPKSEFFNAKKDSVLN